MDKMEYDNMYKDYKCPRCKGRGEVLLTDHAKQIYYIPCQYCNKDLKREIRYFNNNLNKKIEINENKGDMQESKRGGIKGQKKVLTGVYKGVWRKNQEKRIENNRITQEKKEVIS